MADKLDGANVMRQLLEMGMVSVSLIATDDLALHASAHNDASSFPQVSVVRARKQGFAHRYTFERFTTRYAHLLKDRDAPDAVCTPAYLEHLKVANPPAGDRRDCVTILAMMVADEVLAPGGWAVGTGKVSSDCL